MIKFKYKIGQTIFIKDKDWFIREGLYDDFIELDKVYSTGFINLMGTKTKIIGRRMDKTKTNKKILCYKVNCYPITYFYENMICSMTEKLTELVNEI